MIIDWHCHVYPPEEATADVWQGRSTMTIENLLDIHSKAGVDKVVVTDPVHYLRGRSDEQVLDGIKRWNDYAAELAAAYSERVILFSSAVPGGGVKHLREVERAVRDLGLRGVFINSSHHGHYPDEDEARPFFELCDELGVPVMIHAPAASFGEESMNMYRLISSIGRPLDEALAIARMIVRGVFEELPNLKFVGAHAGGGISTFIGRLDFAYELGDEAFFLGSYEPLLITKKPSEYLRQIYFDTATFHEPTLMAAIRTVGPDHVVFGSDSPPLSSLLPSSLTMVRGLDIPESDRQNILGGNAARLLGLEAQ